MYFSFCFIGDSMNSCNFNCVYKAKDGTCKQGGGECIRDCCPEYLNCDSCRRAEDCEV